MEGVEAAVGDVTMEGVEAEEAGALWRVLRLQWVM